MAENNGNNGAQDGQPPHQADNFQTVMENFANNMATRIHEISQQLQSQVDTTAQASNTSFRTLMDRIQQLEIRQQQQQTHPATMSGGLHPGTSVFGGSSQAPNQQNGHDDHILDPNLGTGATGPILGSTGEGKRSSDRHVYRNLSATYDGVDRNLYPQFKTKLLNRLDRDGAAMGSENLRVNWAFEQLEGDAGKRLHPWIEVWRGNTSHYTIAGFVKAMDDAFLDPHAQRNALNWINDNKQGSRAFREYLAEFEENLLKAGGIFDDNVRKGFLRSGISLKMKRELVGKQEPATYTEFVNHLRLIADDLDDFEKKRSRWGQRRETPGQEATSAPANDAMDWQPTAAARVQAAATKRVQANASGAKKTRARWVSTKEIQRRRDNRLCIRCESDNHFLRACEQLPAQRPETSVRTATAKPTPTPCAETASGDGEFSDIRSGKE